MSYMTDKENQANMYCGFYPSRGEDRKYGASDFGKFLNGLICDGVFLTIYDQFKVTPDPENATGVEVHPGKAWFNGTWLELTSIYNIDCGESSQNGDRNDSIVIAINTTDSNYSYNGVVLPARDTTIVCINGLASIVAGNHEISLGVYLYPLADIYREQSSSIITSTDIRIRVGDAACPYVETLLTPSSDATDFTAMWRGQLDDLIDNMEWEWRNIKDTYDSDWETYFEAKQEEIDSLISREEAKIESWFNGIQNSLGEDEAVNLQSQINANEIENILRSGLSACDTTISPDGSVITSVGPDGMKLIKTFTNEFKTITTILTDASNVELGKLIIDISSDGSTIKSTLTTLY